MTAKRIVRGLICLVLATGASSGAEEISDTSNKVDLLADENVQGAIAITDAWLESVYAFRDLPSMSVGFVVDQELIFSKSYGYANPRRKRLSNADTIYSICSISKLFTSIGLMQLRDQGKLSLHDPVADHLSWYNIEQAHAAQGPARIKGLLTHSSGLPRESDFPYWSDKEFPFPTRTQMLEQLANQQTLYPADTLFQYSNLGITLVGEIVSQNSGMPYEEYVTTEILEPLGLADTRPRFPEELHGKQMAIGYSGRGRDLKRKPVKPFHTRAIAPAAGFTSTVNDLAKFASWNFRTLEGDANRVLAPNTLREMQRVHWVNPDWKTTWGLGFVVSKGTDGNQVGHSGGCPGFITNLVMVPKNKTAAIALTSATDGPAHLATKAMLENIGKAVKGANKTTTAASKSDSANNDPDLTEFSGNYGGTVWGGETLIRVWGKQLAIARAPSDNLRVEKLKHIEGDTFLRITAEKEEREHWHFQRHEDGSVVSVKIHGSVAQKLL